MLKQLWPLNNTKNLVVTFKRTEQSSSSNYQKKGASNKFLVEHYHHRERILLCLYVILRRGYHLFCMSLSLLNPLLNNFHYVYLFLLLILILLVLSFQSFPYEWRVCHYFISRILTCWTRKFGFDLYNTNLNTFHTWFQRKITFYVDENSYTYYCPTRYLILIRTISQWHILTKFLGSSSFLLKILNYLFSWHRSFIYNNLKEPKGWSLVMPKVPSSTPLCCNLENKSSLTMCEITLNELFR